jgi:HEPN domain-containing protein
MSHLAIEKALKGLYQGRLGVIPPKTHNLVYLLQKMEVVPPEYLGRFLVTLNQASVVTRYPEDLARLQQDYTRSVVDDLLKKAGESLQWIKSMSKK